MTAVLPPTPTADVELLDALRADVTGTVAAPGEPGYERAMPWNVAVPVAPAAVVFAVGADDVAATMRVAAAHGLTVAVAATGHGAVPIDDTSVLVHTGDLTECVVDEAGRSARIGAGVRWQQVIDLAAPHGLAPLVGSSPSVGVVGFLTGCGIGPFVRTHGLSSDHVRAFDLVTGAGDVLRVTPDEHADLFWGLRGGKGTLGIVTAVEIDLLPIASFHGGALYFDGADADAVLRTWRDWSLELPESANTSIAFLQLPPLPDVPPPLAGRFTVAVRYTSTAEPTEAARLLAPMRAVAEPIIDMVGVMPYAAIGAVHADPVDPMPSTEQHTLLAALPDEAVDAMMTGAGPQSGSPQVIVEIRRLGGAFARPAAIDSAFCQRDAEYTLMAIGVLAPEIAAIVPGHAAGLMASMQPWSTGGRLANFGASGDPERIARCYDEDTRHWLAALGEQYDPAGVLRVGQVVRHPR
ncbi:FAD-binding oxidoreductase [Williamsia deligens]|uniref:FAD-binding oxidoreductase n=1 Tax=Williamsia deligens TaxID=321325 RepID=A0ABW3GC41_9NOCA|nr:FAD-binding oxidoreductase [Williamsia deligens]MCP2192956.1 FAD binding domain-containing protein [Williamsia deligens]